MTRPKLLVAGVAWLVAANTTLADSWDVDHARSRLAFQPTWEGVPFEGEFRRFRAEIEFQPALPADGRFDVSVDIAAADAGGADLNEGMALPEFFDSAHHPQARFVTTAIEPDGNSGYLARGTLTVKGVTRAVALPFTWEGTNEGARLRGELVVDRSDFNIGEGDWADGDAIGLDVRIIVDLNLVRAQ